MKEYEPAQDRVEAGSSEIPVQSLHNVKSITKNEPAQSLINSGFSQSSIKAIENEPAGASVACLAAMRFERGDQDNPLSLAPLYLKESTAKVFVNKYLGKA